MNHKVLISLAAISLSPLLIYQASAQEKETDYNGWHDSLWVSPDGKMGVFMHARYNFFPTILKGKSPEEQKLSYKGHHPNTSNPWDDSDLYIMFKQSDGGWSTPINMPTNDEGADCCAMIAGDEMFFQKGTDLYVTHYKNETWAPATKLSVNSDKIDTNPHFDFTTNTLYWASDRGGNMDIWSSTRNDDKTWNEPRQLNGDINTPAKEDQPYATGNTIRFSRDGESGNLIATNHNGHWTKGTVENLGYDQYHAEISVSSDGNTAWFVAADTKGQQLLFMETQKTENGTWGKATPLHIKQ